jgi:hypothetical protein
MLDAVASCTGASFELWARISAWYSLSNSLYLHRVALKCHTRVHVCVQEQQRMPPCAPAGSTCKHTKTWQKIIRGLYANTKAHLHKQPAHATTSLMMQTRRKGEQQHMIVEVS